MPEPELVRTPQTSYNQLVLSTVVVSMIVLADSKELAVGHYGA